MTQVSEEREWAGDFTFVVMADSQLGMLHENASWEEEKELLECAVAEINEIRPRFAVRRAYIVILDLSITLNHAGDVWRFS